MAATIYLDPDDVVGSIKAKIDLAGEDMLTLIVPYGLRALHSPINLRLLRRHLEGMGLRATLVSRDEQVRRLASAEGLSVRATEDKGPASLADDVVRSSGAYAAFVEERARSRSRAQIAGWAGALALVVAIAVPATAGFFLLPTATVVLYPQSAPFDDVLQVRASTVASRPDPTTLVMPAELLQKEFQVQDSLDISSAASAATRAQGRVSLVNISRIPVEIPAGSRVVSADGRTYALQSAVTLPPAGEESAGVVADQSGPEGNANAGALDRLADVVLAPSVRMTNTSAVQGGRERTPSKVTDAHHQQLRERLMAAARADGLKALQQQRPAGASFYDDSISLRVTAEELDPPAGVEASKVSLKLSGTARAIAFKNDEVNRLLRRYLSPTEPNQQLLEAPFSVAPLELVRADVDEITFRLRVQGARGPRVEEERVKELVKGKSIREAEAAIAGSMPLIGQPRVDAEPFWATGVPVFPWRINVRQGGSR